MNFSTKGLGGPKNKTQLFVGAVVLVVALFLLFFIARGIFQLLSFAAPFLLLLALLINYKVVLNYGKSIWNNLKTNTLFGILMVLFTVIGFPIVSAYLLIKAIFYKRVDLLTKEADKHKDEFTDFEEVSDSEDFLDLREIEKLERGGKEKNDYENLF